MINNKPIIMTDDIIRDADTLAVTDTDSDIKFDINNIIDYRPNTLWKAASAGTKYITIDMAAARDVNALGVIGHNLASADADVSLEYLSTTLAASWTAQTAGGGYSGPITGATYGNGLFVIVGNGGEIQTSPDAVTWTPRTAGGSYAGAFTGATYGNGLFVIVGSGGEIQTSPDGTTWTARTADGSYAGIFRAAAYGNSLFTIVGDSGEIQTSPDGTTWTARTAAGGYSAAFLGATYGNGLFVIVGTTGEIQTSPDGTTWTAGTAAGGFSGLFRAATYGNGLVTIVGDSGEIQTSDFWAEAIAPFTPAADRALMKTFTLVSSANWRIKIVTAAITPYIGVIFLGDSITLPKYPQGNYAPTPERVQVENNINRDGQFIGGIRFQRTFNISLSQTRVTDAWVNDTFRPIWDEHIALGRPLFLAWDILNHPTQILYAWLPKRGEFPFKYSQSRMGGRLKLTGQDR